MQNNLFRLLNGRTLPLLCIASALGVAGIAFADNEQRPICDEITMQPCANNGCYEAFWKAGEAPANSGVCSKLKPAPQDDDGIAYLNPDVPGVGVLHCELDFNSLHCEAWPRGEGFRYEWSRSGAVFAGGPIPDSSSSWTFNCPNPNGGTVNARVFSPYGEHVSTQHFIVPPGVCLPH